MMESSRAPASLIALVHFTRLAIEPINEIFRAEIGCHAEFLNFLDEAIFRRMLECGPLDPCVLHRMKAILTSAENAGATMIVSSGSSLSPAVDKVTTCVRTPVVKVESCLAEEAMQFGRVAVVVTKRSNVEPFQRLLEETASVHGRRLHVHFCVEERAFDALLQNAPASHDRIVIDAIMAASQGQADAILLPQVSVARVIKSLPAGGTIPVLSSAHLSAKRIRHMLLRAIHSTVA
jgi:aspartate/glutamate racemase